MNVINKSPTETPKPYTYLLKFKIGHELKYYYGVRYGNVRHNRIPVNDIFIKYFSSSKYVKALLDDNILPFEIIIHKTFDSTKLACEFEVKFLTRLHIKSRKDFLNQVSHFNNSLPNNLGRIVSSERRLEMSKISKKVQSSDEYKLKRSIGMKSKWDSLEYQLYMEDKYKKFKDSEKGKEFYQNRNQSFAGKTHSNETKRLMSIKAKNRKKYICPLCNAEISANVFKRHLMSAKHNLTESDYLDIIKNNIL